MGIILQGKVKNAELIGTWHRELGYTPHANVFRGFNLVDNQDIQRYKLLSTDTHDLENPVILHQIRKEFFWLENIRVAASLMRPGMILPLHSDRYEFYRQNHSVDQIDDCVRTIVFLEAWAPGHLLLIDNMQLSDWAAGDWICWQGDTVHMAANLGHQDRYTLQITGTLKR